MLTQYSYSGEAVLGKLPTVVFLQDSPTPTAAVSVPLEPKNGDLLKPWVPWVPAMHGSDVRN